MTSRPPGAGPSFTESTGLAAIAATLPWASWRAAASAADRRSLAALALALARPSQARDAAALDAVAESGFRIGRRRAVPPGEGDAAARPQGVTAADVIGDPSGESEGDGGGLNSDWGGLFFLAHPLRELAVMDEIAARAEDPTAVLAALVAAVTGAPADDPAVAVLCSGRAAQPVPPEDAALVEPTWRAAVETWLDERMAQAGISARGERPPGWPWRRRATIETAPSAVTVTFAFNDVDLDIRRAGLDFDPGWIWWLAASVRFRYG